MEEQRLNAQVEILRDGNWYCLSNWDFGKTFRVRNPIRELAQDGFPSAIDMSPDESASVFDPHWIPADKIPDLKRSTFEWSSFYASLTPLRNYPCRVLFWLV